MFRKSLTAMGCLFVLAMAATASAQDYKVEITGFLGYALSEGIDGDNVVIDDTVFNSINPTSAISYGFTVGVFVTENVKVGFLFDVQDSKLEIKGPYGERGNCGHEGSELPRIIAYNWGDDRSVARPFLLGGLGATQYSPGDIMGAAIEGNTKLSSTWGGGVKLYPAKNVGVQVMARWTPTYIKSDPGGICCSPYWPFVCWPVSEADYSNQFELSGGVAFRF